jgi:UDP-N-acetylmuramoylalanine--D-glutamate ligase
MKSTLFADLQLPIAIVGLGVTGNAVHELLTTVGVPAESIITFDEKTPIAHFNKGDLLLRKGQPKTLVVSPGVPLASPWIQEARKLGIKITSELSLANRVLTSERVIAITGSIGKSTTTCLLRASLEKFCPSYFVGGNLGIPLARYATDLIKGQRTKAEWVVLELSSYQLENYPELKAEISVLTYLTSNHLERYNTKEEYFQTKWNLHQQTTASFVLNNNGGELKDWAQSQTTKISIKWTDRKAPIVKQKDLKNCQLLGSHNLDNIAMAAEVATLAQWPPAAFEGLKEFRGLAHRVENLGERNGVRYINDSKATTMESVRTAVASTLETVPAKSTLHLLLGGKDKNLPWEELNSLGQIPNLRFYFFGDCREIAHAKSALSGPTFRTMLEACTAATAYTKPGDSVLLSPGGTSLDEFKNFEHRGEVFSRYLADLC